MRNLPTPPGFVHPTGATPAQVASGTLWAPGQSGNPGGRPKSVGEVRRLAREQTVLAIQTLVEVASDPNATPAARVAAAGVLLDRGYGKAVQPVELGGPGAFDQMTTEELEAYVLDRSIMIARAGKVIDG